MSERHRGDSAEKSRVALPSFPNFPAVGELAAPDFLKLTSNMVNIWGQVNNRLISFAQASIQNNIAAADELRQVQNPKDLVDAQMRIARKAYDDYVEEATKIGQIVQQLSSEAIEVLSPPMTS